MGVRNLADAIGSIVTTYKIAASISAANPACKTKIEIASNSRYSFAKQMPLSVTKAETMKNSANN